MGKIAFVFAGQGAQYPGMGKSLYENSPAAKAVFDAAEAIRPGTIDLILNGTKEALTQTVNTQPAMFCMDWACAAAVQEAGIGPDGCAGFSLGEVVAAGFSGMMSFEEAFRTVMLRAETMQACADAHPGQMAAIVRLTAEEVENMAEPFSDVFPVNFNCPGQTVVAAGKQDQMDEFTKLVTEKRGRAIKLAVSGAFHSPYMQEATKALAKRFEGIEFKPETMPVYANMTALPYGGDKKELLSAQASHPVKWQKTIENMEKDGFDTFIEVGPGKTLTGLIGKIGGAKIAVNCESMDDVKKLSEMGIGGKCTC